MSEQVLTVGQLKEIIKDLPNDLPIECELHKGTHTYMVENAYRCSNEVGEPILSLYINVNWEWTSRDKKAFEEWCKEHDV